MINNIENANIPFFTTNNSRINDSISKTSAGLPRIASVESVKFPFYTGSKINELENQIDVNSINNILKRNSEILNNSVINNVQPLVNRLNDQIREVEKSKHQNAESLVNNSLINNSLNKTPEFLDNTTNLENIQKITKNQRRKIHHKNEQTARDLAKQEAEKTP